MSLFNNRNSDYNSREIFGLKTTNSPQQNYDIIKRYLDINDGGVWTISVPGNYIVKSTINTSNNYIQLSRGVNVNLPNGNTAISGNIIINNIGIYDSMAVAPSAATYGVRPAWIGGRLFWSDSYRFSSVDPISAAFSNYNEKSLPKTKTALHKVRTGAYSGTHYQAKIICIGDSVTTGTAINKATCGLAECFARELNIFFPTRTDCFIGGEKGLASAAALQAYDPRFSIGASWAVFGAGGTFGGSPFYWATGGGANNFSFTPTGSFDRLDVYYIASDAPWGNATVNVDGGASLGTLAGGTGQGYKKLTVSCTAGTHTINVVPGSANVCPSAMMAWTSTASTVHVFNGGRSGVRSDLYSDATYPWGPISGLSQILPDLCFLMLDTNDSGADGTGATALGTYATRYAAICNAIIASGSELVLVSSPPNNGLGASVIDSYRQIARDLSKTLGVPHIDCSILWDGWASYNTSGMALDANHPNAAGTSYIAKMMARFVAGLA